MLYKRQGIPEEDEIVLCQVTKLFPNSVFVDLLEYGHSGMIHISEVSPGRIRNLRDYVSIGRQLVCKVLHIDRERGHIDLSLRRVNSTQREEKLEDMKQELKAEQLIKNMAKKHHQPAEKLYKTIAEAVLRSYSYIYQACKDVAAGEADLKKLGLEESLAQEFQVVILDKFKPAKVMIRGQIRLQTYLPQGIERIKETLFSIEQVSPTINLVYLGGGRYKLTIEDLTYESAEGHLAQVESILQNFQDKVSTAVFDRSKE